MCQWLELHCVLEGLNSRCTIITEAAGFGYGGTAKQSRNTTERFTVFNPGYFRTGAASIDGAGQFNVNRDS